MAQSKRLLVVAAITTVGTEDITLFMKNGDTMALAKDEYRTRQILEKVLPNAAVGKITDISIDSYKIMEQFSDLTKKRVQFFKVPKEFISKTKKLTATKIKKVGADVGDAEITDQETLVAVIDNKGVINGVENLETQIEHSIMTSPKGMMNFLQRMAKMIDTRGHTVEDLLKFMKLSDLPISDEGDIIAYKAVQSTDKTGVYVDCHSGRVTQKIGSYVFMDDKMVDANRSASCSNGLHICSRRYLRGFSGDKILICRIPPENFIAVPYGEPEKVRVSGYHILAEVNEVAYKALKSDKPVTTDLESARLVGEILVGKHINIIEKVEIRAPKGGNLAITKVAKTKIKKATRKPKKVVALDPNEQGKPKRSRKDANPMSTAEMNSKIRKSQAKAKKPDGPDDRIKAAVAAVKAGEKSKAEIAKEFGTSTRTLGRWVDKYGSEVSRFDGATPEQILALGAIEQGKTKAEAAALAKTSSRTIGRWMVKFNVTHP